MAFAVLRNHENPAASQAVLRRVQARRLAVEDDHVAVLEAQPHSPDSVCMQDPAAVRRESRLRAQVRPLSAAPPQDSPHHAASRYSHPQIAGLVLGDCLDHRSAFDAWDIDV